VADHMSQWPTQYPAVKRGYSVQTQFNPAIRAATADRERTVDVLKAAFAEGRLTQDEYTERMGRAYEARTYGQLAAIVADLPVGPIPHPSGPYVPSGPPQRSRTNALAQASMLLGFAVPIFGITAIPAIVTGHRARREIRQTGEEGDGMAVVGLVLGYLAVVVGMILLLALITVGVRHGAHPFTKGFGGGDPGGFDNGGG
jgi:uncharacterized membrane protein